jgi:predicted lysophospholipase L1 biosynthesis ABC-type transport system permease subunit
MWRALIDAGGIGIPAIASEQLRGDDVEVVVLDGRAPMSGDEVAVGPATARQLGLSIDDTFDVGGRKLRVVGRALFAVEVHNGFDEGMWVLPDTLRALAPPTDPEAGSGPYPIFFFDWAPGVEPEAGLPALEERFPDAFMIEPASVPQELANLRNVRTVPLVLAGFLLLLAVATLLHTLLESSRTRRRDFAVFRALGGTRRLLAIVVGAQATTIALVGLLIGIPLGVFLGRLAWAWLSNRVPIVFSAPVLVALLLVVVPVAVLAANLLAALAARSAARGRPASVLRTE